MKASAVHVVTWQLDGEAVSVATRFRASSNGEGDERLKHVANVWEETERKLASLTSGQRFNVAGKKALADVDARTIFRQLYEYAFLDDEEISLPGGDEDKEVVIHFTVAAAPVTVAGNNGAAARAPAGGAVAGLKEKRVKFIETEVCFFVWLIGARVPWLMSSQTCQYTRPGRPCAFMLDKCACYGPHIRNHLFVGLLFSSEGHAASSSIRDSGGCFAAL